MAFSASVSKQLDRLEQAAFRDKLTTIWWQMANSLSPTLCIITTSVTLDTIVTEVANGAGCKTSSCSDWEAAPFPADFYIVDRELVRQDLRTSLLTQSPRALLIGIAENRSEDLSLKDVFDLFFQQDEISTQLLIAIRVFNSLNSKVPPETHLQELLAELRQFKHKAANTLAIACGTAGRMAKDPKISEIALFTQLRTNLDLLAKQLDHVRELYEKYRSI